MKKKTKQKLVEEILNKLSINESISKSEIVKEIYGYDDFFVRRTFDVMLCKFRKNTNKEFSLNTNNIIIRIN